MVEDQTPDDGSPKSRVLRLFKFLFEVNRLRNRPERTLREQVLVIPLTQLPEHPAIQMVRPVLSEGQPPVEFELRVARAPITACPEPPSILREWLISGWDDPSKEATYAKSQNTVAQNGETATIEFADAPERIKAWEQWARVRSAWTGPEEIARTAQAFFEKLYELHALLEKDGERLEFMVGDGMLTWQARSSMELTNVAIEHPILLKRVELIFDAVKPEFRVVDAGRDTELYTSSLVDLEGLNAKGIAARQEELSTAGYHPLGYGDTQAFMTALVQTLSPTHGLFLEHPGNAIEPYPRLWRQPVLLVRRRVQGITNAISSIIDHIESGDFYPPAFGQIVGIPKAWESGLQPDAASGVNCSVSSPPTPVGDDSEILLAKETNEEQMQIIRRLARSGSVVVQGPPGTGKTHTIANVIGHLLAQGKTILVTSHTPKALRVLRDQIPEDLRPLCVSATGGDLESRRQLEAAITEINSRLARASVETLEKQIEQRMEERRKLLEKNRRLTADLRQALESEYLDISYSGNSLTPAAAARQVRQQATADSWLPGPIAAGQPLPLSGEDLSQLYATNIEVDAAEERDATCLLPSLEGLMSPDHFRTLIAEINSLTATDLTNKAELWNRVNGAASAPLVELLDELRTAFSEHYRKLTWRPYAICAGMKGGTHRQVWETLAARVSAASELAAKHSLNLHHQPTLSSEFIAVRQCEVLEEILNHIGSGGGLGTLQLITRTEWRTLIKTAKVAAGKPSREEHFRSLLLLANLKRLREEIEALWEALIARNGGPRFADLGADPEQSARSVAEEIGHCLDWHKNVWVDLVERLKANGLNFDRLLAGIPREPSATAEYDLAEKAAVEILPQVLESEIRRRHLDDCDAEILRQLHALLDIREERGCIGRLIAAMGAKDPENYELAVKYTRRLHEISPVVKCRQQLLIKLGHMAPTWAAEISNRLPPHNVMELPGDPIAAWTWRQLHEELDRRHRLDAQGLQSEIEHNRRILREVTLSLIDLRAWVNQIKRVQANHLVRQALVGWLDAIKKIKSTHKKDILWKLQAEARNLMKLSARAVPVWIMPLAVAAENFDPATTRFDVVIIDEASQADLNALVAIYQADKVIVVGDHEQVTPEAVGKDQSLVHNLIDTYLRDIPNSRLFDNRFSIYDLGRQSFGDAICLLEHFRCVPEIIAFSNRLSYDGRIRPLRESNSTTLKPSCVAYQVHGVAQNQLNHKEAETIVDMIAAMCRHAEYAGKTIGVISMVGESQANLIDSKLRQRLDPVEYERRRIICGNSAQFQGDERDVIFLSMIDSGKEHGLGPIAKKGEGAFDATKKRYNVAASRARDQLWVVHSLDPNNDLKPGDLRRDLILHAQNPASTINLFKQEEPRVESEFERKVLRILVNKGYNVRTQWSVGYYRIDMVVQGNGKRLALECDGDRWHPVEKLSDDMARQAILERLGWKFVRIRGSEFFRDEEQAMLPVFRRLDELGITPSLSEESPTDEHSLVRELEAIVRSSREDPETSESRPAADRGDQGTRPTII